VRVLDGPAIRTIGGGTHLWYRKVGEVRSTNLRSDGLEVDIKADGGFVLVPPSFNPQSGRPYVFERGTWDDLNGLPPFRKEALTAAANASTTDSAISEGHRNAAVFGHLMRMAPQVDDCEALLAEGHRYNREALSPPLPDGEVEKTARSAWRYQSEGKNWLGTHGNVRWPVEVVNRCAAHKHGGDALILTTILRSNHAYRNGPFAIAARAMARDQVIVGWSEHRTRKALQAALKLGLIDLVYQGGHYPGDPSLYRLASCV
jgi:hypothetical protein